MNISKAKKTEAIYITGSNQEAGVSKKYKYIGENTVFGKGSNYIKIVYLLGEDSKLYVSASTDLIEKLSKLKKKSIVKISYIGLGNIIRGGFKYDIFSVQYIGKCK